MKIRGQLRQMLRATALLAVATTLYCITMPYLHDGYVSIILAGLVAVMLAPATLEQTDTSHRERRPPRRH